jgi:hypothetical protein
MVIEFNKMVPLANGQWYHKTVKKINVEAGLANWSVFLYHF